MRCVTPGQGSDCLQGQIDFLIFVEITEPEADCPLGEGPDGPVGRGGTVEPRPAENPETFV